VLRFAALTASINLPRGKAETAGEFLGAAFPPTWAWAALEREQLEDDTGRKFGPLDDNVNLREDLGIDSVDLVTLIVHTQSRLQIEVPSEKLEKAATVGNLLDVLQSRLAGPARGAA
jgi:acyl carrier protein